MINEISDKVNKKEKLMENKYIETNVIKLDIFDIELEVKKFQDELDILNKSRHLYRTRIYILTGKISRRKMFISKLNHLLKEREINVQWNRWNLYK